MIYTALMSFLDSPTDIGRLAKKYAAKWSAMTAEELEAELLPILEQSQKDCDQIKEVEDLRLHVKNLEWNLARASQGK